jgi:APA family basic amino acid/polyamine antiporter
MSEQPAPERFQKVLTSRHVIALAFGAMVGWSWVLVTGLWVSTAGSVGTLIAFLIGGVAISLIGLTYAELASAMPRAGGEHVYTHRALGASWSFVCTWALLFSYINVSLFESVALPTALEYLVPEIRIGTLWNVLGADVDLGFVLVGAGGALMITIINVIGIRFAAMAQVVVTAVIIVSGIGLMLGAGLHGEWQNAAPLIAEPASGIMVVLIMVPAMLVGFDVIPQSAEEINLPPERIGKLLVISIFCAVAWYILISFSVALSMGPLELAGTRIATADAATSLWGHPSAGALLVLGGIGGILTSWNAFIIGASRVLFALAESGLVPAAFARLHPRYNTPYVGIIAIGVLSMLSPLFGRTILVWLINTGSFSVLIAFLFVAISFLKLRQTEPDMPRPYKVAHPRLVAGGAILLTLGLLAAFFPPSQSALMWPEEWLLLLVWIVLGGLVYMRFRKTHASES